MNIKEAIKDNVGRQIKLGFGSSFIYCDKVGEDTENEINHISNKYLAEFQRLKERAEKELDSIVKKGLTAMSETT